MAWREVKPNVPLALAMCLLLATLISNIVWSFTGCGDSASSPEPNKDELRGWASVQVALAASGKAVSPDDAPKPGDDCPTCGGDGVVGDGRIEQECKACDGTGKITREKSDAEDDAQVLPPSGEEKAWPERQADQAFPGGDFRDDEYWCPSRHILWRLAEGTPREGEFLWRGEGGDLIYWRQPLATEAEPPVPSRGWRLFRRGRLGGS